MYKPKLQEPAACVLSGVQACFGSSFNSSRSGSSALRSGLSVAPLAAGISQRNRGLLGGKSVVSVCVFVGFTSGVWSVLLSVMNVRNEEFCDRRPGDPHSYLRQSVSLLAEAKTGLTLRADNNSSPRGYITL